MNEDIRNSYRELKEKASSMFTRYMELAELVYAPEELEKRRTVVADRRRQLETREFSLVVIGEMKHGKSTFLNAMLRKPVFPKDVREATAAVTFLKHNDVVRTSHPEWCDKAVVEFKDRPAIVVDHLDLGKYTTCLHRGELNVAEDVKRVTIYSDSRFVEDGVSVIDTPGMNTTRVMHEQITRDQIERSHAAVFLFKAGEAGKKSDYDFLETTKRTINRFFFVVNRIDEVRGVDTVSRIIDDLKGKVAENPVLGPLLRHARFYPTSGLEGLLSRYAEYFPNEKFLDRTTWERECDPPEKRAALAKSSGMDDFERDLLAFLFQGERTREFLQSHVTYVRGMADEAERYVAEREDVLKKNLNLQELEEKEQRLQAEYEREQAKVESTSSELTEKLAQRMREFVKDCETEAGTIVSDFKERVWEIDSYNVLRRQWDDFVVEIERTAARFANRAQGDMQDAVQAVFRAIDYKVRSELDKSLAQSHVFEMPELEEVNVELVVPETDSQNYLAKIEANEKELREAEARLQQKGMLDVDLAAASRQCEELRRERAEIRAEMIGNMQVLGQRPGVEQRLVSPAHEERRWRSGLIGIILTPIIGKEKHYVDAVYEEDRSAQEEYDRKKKTLEANAARATEEIQRRLQKAAGDRDRLEREAREAVELRKLAEAKRKKEDELRRELRAAQERAQAEALEKMRQELLRTMSDQMNGVTDAIARMSTLCGTWARNFIGGIQTELSQVVQSRRDELESHRKMLKLKREDREAELVKIAKAREIHQDLISSVDSMASDLAIMSL